MSKMDEIIVVVEREKLFDNEKLAFQGLLTDDVFLEAIGSNMEENIQTMRRGDAEENNKFKQPIPYGIIKRGNEIFVYKRLSGGGETRLHEKTSIGVGGHMNDIEDCLSLQHLIAENLLREITEEIEIKSDSCDLEVIGLINDDLDEVGEVHIGVLSVIHIPEGTEVKVKETDQLEGYFLTVEQLNSPKHFETLENWSKIAAQILA